MSSVNSPTPGTPQTPAKAINGASVSTAVVVIGTWLVSYFTSGNDADLNTLLAAIGTGLANFAITYLTVFATKNKPLGGRYDDTPGI